MDLNEEQISRYSRHIILKEIGLKGQEKLLQSQVLVIGAGGLGSPVLLYLASAGIGTIGIIDGDNVDITNLQRQIIHFTEDIDKPKVISAKEKINKLNPDVKVNIYNDIIHSKNIMDIIKDYDFIIDGTDNFSTKFLINDACVIMKKPYSHAGVLRFEGQTFTYLPDHTCYRCIFNSPPPKDAVPTCSQAGIVGAIAGILGTIQAMEAIKFITQTGTLLVDSMLIVDAKSMDIRKVNFKRNKNCPICGNNPTIKEVIDIELPVCDLKKRGDTND